MRKIIILGLFTMIFVMCAGFTACGGAYYSRNIGVSGYVEQSVHYQPVYYPAYGPAYIQEPICGFNTSGLPLRCTGSVAPSYQRDMWRSFYGW